MNEINWKETRVTPEKITKLKPNEVFVFGSNLAGRHGAGAAKQALKWGAKYGEGFGLHGQTFAIPTKDKNLNTLGLGKIMVAIEAFRFEARKNKDKMFLVTKIGCGLAGYTSEQIAPKFKHCIDEENIILPIEFREVILGYKIKEHGK